MESLVALGFAANVVQFVEFATKVVTQTVRIYRINSSSSPRSTNDDLDALSSRIVQFTKPLKLDSSVVTLLNGDKTSKSLPAERDEASKYRRGRFDSVITEEDQEALDSLNTERVARLSACDQEILRACSGCEEIAASLCSALAKLKSSKKTLWGSFAEALRTIWSEHDIQELRQRLDRYREQMTFLLIVSVREKIEFSQVKQRQSHVDIFQSTQAIRSTLVRLFEDQKIWKQEVIRAINKNHLQHSQHQSDESLEATTLQSHPTTGSSAKFNSLLLQWITFPEISTRIDKIAPAHAKTFEWIFHPPKPGEWYDFTKWLEEETQDLYWINGKPAAGKSTLLKFMYRDERTVEHLENWSKGKKLINCAFYFWNSGSPMQMSETAMLRTFLHSALRQAPELCTAVFPSKLEEFIMFGEAGRIPIPDDDIKEAFRLLCKGAGSTYRLFLFVDGLDEFGGDHDQLVTTIKGLSSTHVKICVSSRPWQTFQDGFGKYPSLRLETITYNDIKQYITTRFEESEGFKERQKETSDEINQLVESITKKASGVFLWVRLVTDSLLRGLSRGESLQELRDRLEAVPTDLEELFQKILIDVTKTEKAEISHLLQIMRSSHEPFSLLDFSYADDASPDIVLTSRAESQLTEHGEGRALRMRRRLRNNTKCLLEAESRTGECVALVPVTYLHRTVRDYIERENIWDEILAMSDEKFNLALRLYNMYTIRIKTRSKVPKDESEAFWRDVLHAVEYATIIDPVNELGQQGFLLNQLDEVATEHTGGAAKTHWSCTKKNGYMNTKFVHLAIQLQLNDFVKHTLLPEPNSRQDISTNDLNKMLFMATLHYDIFNKVPGVSHLRIIPSAPSADLVSLFLENGADPNCKIDGALLSHGNIPGAFSPWQIHLREPKRDTENWTTIATLFLHHGANPALLHDGIPGVSPAILAMAQRKAKDARAAAKTFDVKKLGAFFHGQKVKYGLAGKSIKV